MTDFETLLYDERDGVATVTMNRPEVHNAFDAVMRRELQAVWRDLRRNEDVRVVILTGAGDQAFCVGYDREEGIQRDYLDAERDTHHLGRASPPFQYTDVVGTRVNPKENDLWKPVVAAVNGMACAGALYLLGEADIIIAAEHATFFDPHVTYGMVAGFESAHLLQKLPLGETLRSHLLAGWERLSAERAHQLGLVSEVCPAAELMDRARWVADVIAEEPVLAVQGTLKALWLAHALGRRQALAQMSTLVALAAQEGD